MSGARWWHVLLNPLLGFAVIRFEDTFTFIQTKIDIADGKPSHNPLLEQLHTHKFKGGGGIIVSHGFHHASKGPKVFCTVVFRNETDLIVEVAVALRQCNGYAIVSNHTTTLDETEKQLKVQNGINGTMDAKTDRRWGNPENTFIFKQLWDFLAKDPYVKEYDWIIKIDPDTFLRPDKLESLFRRHSYKSSVPMIVSHRPNTRPSLSMQAGFKCCEYYDENVAMWKRSGIRGGFFMMSRAFFKIYRKHGCKTSHRREPAEDIWWDRCMETRPYRKTILARPERDCIDTIYDAHMYHPVGYNTINEMRAPLNRYMLKNLIAGEEMFHKQGFCLSPDIVAIHPVKNPLAHRILRDQLYMKTDAYLNSPKMTDVLYPTDGWTVLPEDAAKVK